MIREIKEQCRLHRLLPKRRSRKNIKAGRIWSLCRGDELIEGGGFIFGFGSLFEIMVQGPYLVIPPPPSINHWLVQNSNRFPPSSPWLAGPWKSIFSFSSVVYILPHRLITHRAIGRVELIARDEEQVVGYFYRSDAHAVLVEFLLNSSGSTLRRRHFLDFLQWSLRSLCLFFRWCCLVLISWQICFANVDTILIWLLRDNWLYSSELIFRFNKIFFDFYAHGETPSINF